MINKVIYFIAVICLLSCGLENKRLTRIDTIAVFNEVLKSKLFLEDNIQQDTLYFVKSKFYNLSYPKRTKYFEVLFIDDLPINKTLNHPNKLNDKRTRLDIVNFVLKNDTINLTIVDCGVNMNWNYKLVKPKKDWEILTEGVVLNNNE